MSYIYIYIYIYGAPCQARNFNVVCIYGPTFGNADSLLLSICCTMFQHWINVESYPVAQLCVNTLPDTEITLITDGIKFGNLRVKRLIEKRNFPWQSSRLDALLTTRIYFKPSLRLSGIIPTFPLTSWWRAQRLQRIPFVSPFPTSVLLFYLLLQIRNIGIRLYRCSLFLCHVIYCYLQCLRHGIYVYLRRRSFFGGLHQSHHDAWHTAVAYTCTYQ
jgi:hypothetical protein